MSERETYPAGVPCWVDNLVPEPQRAMGFYGELLGWEFVGPGPGGYYVAQLRGRDVAGVGSAPEGVAPGWNTYVSVASVEEAVRAAAGAGGSVIAESVDASPAGRLGVVADRSGAVIGLWEPVQRHGAQLVNEPGAWAMSVLHAGDGAAAEAFYREVFGWEAEEFGALGMKLFRLPGYVGGEPAQPVPRDVVAVVAAADGEPHWSVGLWVGDADAAAAKAGELGGRVIAAPFDGGGMRQAVLCDPFGAAFGVTTAPGH